jgi:hypothetical protein
VLFGGLVLYKAAADAWFWRCASFVLWAEGSGHAMVAPFAVVALVLDCASLLSASSGALGCVAIVGWLAGLDGQAISST